VEIKIEKNIPVPGKRADKYPWGTMEVSDSFYSDTKPITMRNLAFQAGRRHNMKFLVRAEKEGSRVWRVE
jgi:hypothetical protein